jgi:prepilin-type N-terminal cleavage/methylation domain-containing protein
MSSEKLRSEKFGIGSRGGFTMIELMVVVAIIIMASGIMGPTLLDFMKNRQLEGIRGQFGNIFNMARLQAVNQRRDMSVVFFREGPRVFDELRQEFIDYDVWLPEESPLGEEEPTMWYALGFARGTSSYNPQHDQEGQVISQGLTIPPFKKWLSKQKSSPLTKSRKPSRRSRSRRTSSGKTTSARPKYRTSGLFKVTFNRNGTLVFSDGCSDVPTSVYNGDEGGRPRTSDVVILQLDATPACFIDVRPTGQVRSKVVPLADSPRRRGDVSSINQASRSSAATGGKGRKKSRK